MVQVIRIRSGLAGAAALVAAVCAYVIVGPMAGVTWSMHHGSGYYAARFVGLATFPVVATILCDILYHTLDRSNLVVGWRRDLGGELLRGLGRKRYTKLQKTRPDEMRAWEQPYARGDGSPQAKLKRFVPANPVTYNDERRRHLLLVEDELLPRLLGTPAEWIHETYWKNRHAYDFVGIIRTAIVLGSGVGVVYSAVRATGQNHLDLEGLFEGIGIVAICDVLLMLCANSVRRTTWKNMRDTGSHLGRHYRDDPAALLAIVPLSQKPGSRRRIEAVNSDDDVAAAESPQIKALEEDAAIFDQEPDAAPGDEQNLGPEPGADLGDIA